MLEPRLRRNGNLIVPYCVIAPNGTRVDGLREITPDDPEYEEWLAKVPGGAEHRRRQTEQRWYFWRRRPKSPSNDKADS